MQCQSEVAPRTRVDIHTLEAVALAATRRAAVASYAWTGRHDQKAADAAATTAMREALADAPGRGTVVIGEGEKDEAPMLFNGEIVEMAMARTSTSPSIPLREPRSARRIFPAPWPRSLSANQELCGHLDRGSTWTR